jgi:hypothetical protein
MPSAGAQLSVRRSDGSVGSRRGLRGAARSGAGARGSQAGSVAGASSVEQVSVALGQRPAAGLKAWTQLYMAWVRQLRFEQVAQESTRLDYLHEVEHMAERVKRLEQAIAEAVKLASPELQEVVKDLQALRGIAQISAVTIAAELGNITRFESARQLMGYSGAVPTRGLQRQANPAREHHQNRQRASATNRCRSGLELSAAARRRTGVAQATRGVPEELKEIAWKAQNRLAQALLQAGGGRQGPAQDHHRGGTRTAGLHLGHRDQGGSGSQAAHGGLTKNKNKAKAKTFQRMKKQKPDQ